jgi:8-oxo-dGTP pyrophosphatase MutT (NUDIX family)
MFRRSSSCNGKQDNPGNRTNSRKLEVMESKPLEVAIAILHTSDRFLMQLRDNNPNIIYPGCWAFFGGHLDPGETPEEAVKRELLEEISYAPPVVSEFGCYPDSRVIRHVFHAPLTVELNQLVLTKAGTWIYSPLTR